MSKEPKHYDIEEAFRNSDKLIEEMKKGKIFLYPTDTVYGIGCDASNPECVKKIYEIKKRKEDKPLSVIAPNEEWILNNFKISKPVLRLYLPGPYTLLVEKKDPAFLRHLSPNNRLGIRIPEHSFTLLVMKAGIPFVTTSANLSGKEAPSSLEEVEEEIVKKVDYVIEGPCFLGKPSTLVEIDENIKEIKRS
ncbi:MAG: threonylcarbamoyl-AMP synthase [Candidatus Nanohaloarchaeota archaeon]|nr:threonylcarbamoyl-AMP synthase [Candidatus Nanohaloarchaeota archaeon]